MFEALFTFLNFLVSALPELRASDRKKVAKALLRVYREVMELAQNGSEILTLMKPRAGELLYEEPAQAVKQLRSLLLDQEKRIKRLRSMLKKNQVETVLSIKLPEIHPIMLQLLEEKGNVLVFYLDAIDWSDPELLRPETSEFVLTDPLPPSKFEIDQEILRIPYEEEIDKAESHLIAIKELAGRLRGFLAGEFSIEELT